MLLVVTPDLSFGGSVAGMRHVGGLWGTGHGAARFTKKCLDVAGIHGALLYILSLNKTFKNADKCHAWKLSSRTQRFLNPELVPHCICPFQLLIQS